MGSETADGSLGRGSGDGDNDVGVITDELLGDLASGADVALGALEFHRQILALDETFVGQFVQRALATSVQCRMLDDGGDLQDLLISGGGRLRRHQRHNGGGGQQGRGKTRKMHVYHPQIVTGRRLFRRAGPKRQTNSGTALASRAG